MYDYTHALFTDALTEDGNYGLVVELSEVQATLESLERASRNFHLFDASVAKVKRTKDGRRKFLCRDTGGWSYGHVQHGWICAGAGGLNSLPVIEMQ